MPTPKPGSTLKQVKARLDHLESLAQRLQGLCGHWNHEIKTQLEATVDALANAQTLLSMLPADFQPPRRPIVRGYSTLKAGDRVRLNTKSEKRYMTALRGQALTLVSSEDGWATVELSGRDMPCQVELKHLVAANK